MMTPLSTTNTVKFKAAKYQAECAQLTCLFTVEGCNTAWCITQ